MADALEMFLDARADAAVRALWQRLDDAGVPSLGHRSHGRHRPHVTFAVAAAIPRRARDRLGEALAVLTLPRLWLHTLGTFPTTENALVLAAVVDTELLAVHAAVHDALAGATRGPSAYYLPGSWVPHCTLAQGVTDAELVAGFAALHPVEPVHAALASVAITDTRTGEIEPLTR